MAANILQGFIDFYLHFVLGFLGHLTSNESYYHANPSKYLHQQKGGESYEICNGVESFDTNISDIPSALKEDDASSVGTLNDSDYETEDEGDSDDNCDDDDGDDDLGIQKCGEQTTMELIDLTGHSFKLLEDEEDTLESMLTTPVPILDRTIYFIHVYGYYRKSKGYGGYGIMLYKSSYRTPIGAYYGVSTGGSHLYYLLDGMKKALQIAYDRRLPRIWLSINSSVAKNLFNQFFVQPHMLKTYFHSNPDVANLNFCKKCLKHRMWLNDESFKLLLPVFEAIIKMQLETKFKYRQGCTLQPSDAAYYLAKRGAEALEKKMKLGASSDEVQEEAEMKMEELPEWLRNGESKYWTYI